MLLFLLGAAVRRVAVERALGAATLASLLEHGLLLHAGEDGLLPGEDGHPGEDGPASSTELLASPVQVYPVPTRRGAAAGAADVGGAEATTEAGAGDCGEVGAGGGGGAGDAEDGGAYGDEELLEAGLNSEGELLVATDWARESLVPAKFAVMPIGDDSLNLVHLAPRRRCHRVLDLCTGSGVQALVAARCYAEAAVATDVNPRALRFVNFNAALNGLAARVTTRQGDGYAALTPSPEPSAPSAPPQCADDEPFDAILANPPFVAVPPPPPGASMHAEWALYADGGPDGGRVLDAIIAGANTARLRPGGHLAIVSEFPNIRGAHRTLAAMRPGLDLALFYDPLHVQVRVRVRLRVRALLHEAGAELYVDIRDEARVHHIAWHLPRRARCGEALLKCELERHGDAAKAHEQRELPTGQGSHACEHSRPVWRFAAGLGLWGSRPVWHTRPFQYGMKGASGGQVHWYRSLSLLRRIDASCSGLIERCAALSSSSMHWSSSSSCMVSDNLPLSLSEVRDCLRGA